MAGPLSFAARVIAWQKSHGRHDLPWQRSRNPYRIWLSEIMLQQTQVAVVAPYFERFVQQFPDVQSLAAAPLEAVMSLWAGLGYYSRARNLHACARRVVEHHGGKFPRSACELAQLPGIGRSTAAAIAALAYGERAAILEGNVKRVLARHFDIEGYPGDPAIGRLFWQRAEDLLPEADIEAYTQGLMDLGAMVCARTRPLCTACPVAQTCIARREHKTAMVPTARPPKPRPVRSAIVLVLRSADGAVLLEPRPPAGIWSGLLSLPELPADLTDASIVAEVEKRYGIRCAAQERLRSIRHEFTHYTFDMQPCLAQVSDVAAVSSATLRSADESQLHTLPLPAPIRRLLLQL